MERHQMSEVSERPCESIEEFFLVHEYWKLGKNFSLEEIAEMDHMADIN